MLAVQLGESAEELVLNWRGGYRGGYPDFVAVEPTARPYDFDASRVFTGVIGYRGRKWMFDPNLRFDVSGYGHSYGYRYGLGAVTSPAEALSILRDFLTQDVIFTDANNDDFDVVFDNSDASGLGLDLDNKLIVVHGGTLRAINEAANIAGSSFPTFQPSPELAQQIQNARSATPDLATSTLGKSRDVQAAARALITRLTQSTATTSTPVTGRTTKQKVAIGAAVGLAGLGISALVWFGVRQTRR